MASGVALRQGIFVAGPFVAGYGPALQIDFDFARRRRTTDQCIPCGWRLEWIRLIVDTTSDQCTLAGMADPRAARPLNGNVASFCKFQQTEKP